MLQIIIVVHQRLLFTINLRFQLRKLQKSTGSYNLMSIKFAIHLDVKLAEINVTASQ